MGTISSRSPAMAYKDGNIWNSTFDDAGNRCWVNSATGEKTYHFIGGKAVRRPSNTATSPYTMQSPGRVSRRPSNTATSPYTMQSPGRVSRCPSNTAPSPYAMQSPGHVAPWAAAAPAMHSPAPAGYAVSAIHSPAPAGFAGPAMHSPVPAGFAGPAMHSPARPAAGYGAANLVPYYQPGYVGGAPNGDPTPTAAGEAVGYRSSKYYVRPRSKKSWMWTQQ